MRKGNVLRLARECGIIAETFQVRFKRNNWCMPITLADMKAISVSHLEVHSCRVMARPAEEWVAGQNNLAAWQLTSAGFPETND